MHIGFSWTVTVVALMCFLVVCNEYSLFIIIVTVISIIIYVFLIDAAVVDNYPCRLDFFILS